MVTTWRSKMIFASPEISASNVEIFGTVFRGAKMVAIQPMTLS